MQHEIDLNDTEYTWPPGALNHERPAPGPEIAGMRLDSIEQRLANLEHGRSDAGRQLNDMQEAIKVAIDALTYLSGAAERLSVLVLADKGKAL
jgi:hypothetical protein